MRIVASITNCRNITEDDIPETFILDTRRFMLIQSMIRYFIMGNGILLKVYHHFDMQRVAITNGEAVTDSKLTNPIAIGATRVVELQNNAMKAISNYLTTQKDIKIPFETLSKDIKHCLSAECNVPEEEANSIISKMASASDPSDPVMKLM